MSKKIAVIGYGYVGKAMVEMLKDHYEILVFDPEYIGENPVEIPHKKFVKLKECGVSFLKSMDEINKASCDLGVVCVPTPILCRVLDLNIIEPQRTSYFVAMYK